MSWCIREVHGLIRGMGYLGFRIVEVRDWGSGAGILKIGLQAVRSPSLALDAEMEELEQEGGAGTE